MGMFLGNLLLIKSETAPAKINPDLNPAEQSAGQFATAMEGKEKTVVEAKGENIKAANEKVNEKNQSEKHNPAEKASTEKKSEASYPVESPVGAGEGSVTKEQENEAAEGEVEEGKDKVSKISEGEYNDKTHINFG